MSLSLNQYLLGSDGLGAALINMPNSPFNTNGSELYIYSSNVPYPSSCPNSVTAGSFLKFTVNAGSFTQIAGTINLSSNISANTTGAGTANWWLLINTTGNGFACCGNSISNTANVGNATVIISNLSPTGSGTNVTCSSFLLTLI
jgi:hypothetical protein